MVIPSVFGGGRPCRMVDRAGNRRGVVDLEIQIVRPPGVQEVIGGIIAVILVLAVKNDGLASGRQPVEIEIHLVREGGGRLVPVGRIGNRQVRPRRAGKIDRPGADLLRPRADLATANRSHGMATRRIRDRDACVVAVAVQIQHGVGVVTLHLSAVHVEAAVAVPEFDLIRLLRGILERNEAGQLVCVLARTDVLRPRTAGDAPVRLRKHIQTGLERLSVLGQVNATTQTRGDLAAVHRSLKDRRHAPKPSSSPTGRRNRNRA